LTPVALAQLLCAASGIFGRPAWDVAKCAERADWIVAAAERHDVDPVLLVSIDVVECDLRDRDAPVYREVEGRRRLVGFDACPMGMRILGVERRRLYDPRSLYELAARRLAADRARCRISGRRDCLREAIARRNLGNPQYAAGVYYVWGALAGKRVRGTVSIRLAEIGRRLRTVLLSNRRTS
jgi:hypothetical protein